MVRMILGGRFAENRSQYLVHYEGTVSSYKKYRLLIAGGLYLLYESRSISGFELKESAFQDEHSLQSDYNRKKMDEFVVVHG